MRSEHVHAELISSLGEMGYSKCVCVDVHSSNMQKLRLVCEITVLLVNASSDVCPSCLFNKCVYQKSRVTIFQQRGEKSPPRY